MTDAAHLNRIPQDHAPRLGPCCSCDAVGPQVHNIITLPYRCPPGGEGKGWGCLVCGLPQDGAVAVLCDACLDTPRPDRLLRVVVGYAYEGKRVDLAPETLELFDHNLEAHEL